MPLYGRRESKPHQGVAIDPAHPLAQGLVADFVLNEGGGLPIDLTSGRQATSNGATWTSTPYGSGLLFNGTSQSVNCGSNPAWSITALPLTIAALAAPATGAGANQNIAEFRGVGNSGGYSLQVTPAGAISYISAASGTPTINTSSGGAVDGGWHLYSATHGATSAGGVQFFLDGRAWGTATNARVPGAYGSGRLGTNATAAGTWLNGPLALVRIWSRALSAAEHAAHATNPWQVYLPPARRMFRAAPPTGTASLLYYLNRRRRTG